MSSRTPRRPRVGSYLVAVVLIASAVVLFVLRLATYAAGIHLGRDLNIVTFVGVVVLGMTGVAMGWHIDRRASQAEKVEEARLARWRGYGECAADVFNPPLDIDDTSDLLRR